MIGEAAVVGGLILVAVVAVASRRLKIPYTIALVVIGLVIDTLPFVPRVQITSRLILLVFLPPLLFEASFNLDYSSLRRDAPLIAVLAIPGVLASAGITAFLLHGMVGGALGPLLVFGAIIAATDPVSVLAIFRELGAPGRLATVVEGESLLNDGTAIVLFNIVLAGVLTGDTDVRGGAVEFFVVAFGGGALGLLVGLTAVAVLRRIDDHLVEITVTTAVAFGSYLLAEELGVSGVIAVVVAGLMLGNLRAVAMSATTRVALESFWEYVGFVGNGLIFLLVGVRVGVVHLLENAPIIGLAIVSVLLSRAVIVSLANAVMRPGWRLPWRWLPVLWWGGVRGAVALALALSLPLTLPDEDRLELMVFGVVLFSLVAQGLTIKPLLARLGIRRSTPEEHQYQRHIARLHAYRQALREIQRELREGILPKEAAEPIRAEYERALRHEDQALEALRDRVKARRAEDEQRARRQALLAEQTALLDLWEENQLSSENLRSLLDEVDEELSELEDADGDRPSSRSR